MENISSKKIAIQISGNPDSSSGFSSIITLNGLIPLLDDIPYTGVNNCPYFYVLKIASDYTQYTLVHNKATSNSANRGGALKIAVGIPKGAVLKDNVSPNQLLMEVFEYFANSCMDSQPGGNLIYKANVLAIRDELKTRISDILNKYPLAERTLPHRPMTEKGPRALLQIPFEQIDDLFRDIQYPEFSPYGEIVVAQQADSSFYSGRVIPNLVIPRKGNFKIFVNGRPTSKILSSGETTVSAYTDGGYDRNCFEDQQVTLSLDDIRAGKEIIGVKVNFVEERIDVALNPKEKSVTLTINVTGCTMYGNIEFVVGNLRITLKNEKTTYTFKGTQIRLLLENRNASVTYKGQDWQPENSNPPIVRKSSNEYETSIRFRQIQRSSTGGSNLPAKTNDEPTILLSIKGFNPEKYEGKQYEKAQKTYLEQRAIRLTIKNEDGQKKYIINAKVEINDRQEFLRVKLPSDWHDSYCTVVMPEWKLKSNNSKRLSPKAEFKWNDFNEIEEESKFRPPKWVIPVLAFVIALFIGFWGGKKYYQKSSIGKQDPTESTSQEITSKTEEKKYDPVPRYNYYKEEFDKEGLTFETIRQCSKWIKDTINGKAFGDDLKKKLDNFEEFEDEVNAYTEVVETIEKDPDVENLRKILEKQRKEDNNFKLNNKHVELIRKSYKGQGQDYIKRKIKYSNVHNTFTSFLDFKGCDPVTQGKSKNPSSKDNTPPTPPKV